MTTPRREQILQLAKELYFNDMAKSGIQNFNTPEPNELAESGYISSAKSELMRNLETKHAEWLNNGSDLEIEPFSFNVSEGMATTSFVSGSRGVGKTDLCAYIADRLMNEGITVIVFDPSTDWIQRSSISQYFTVKAFSDLPIPETSIIFDISQLTPNEAQNCVERFSKRLFEFQLNNSAKRFYLIFEEAQTYFPLNSLRSRKTQNSIRLICVGRNIGVSACAVSQFPSLIDKELVKHSGQIYIGYSTELNLLVYWKGILGSYAEKLKELSNGQFVYYHRNKISLTEIEPYQNAKVKTQIAIPQPTLTPIAIKQNNNAQAISSLIVAGLWFLAVVLALSGRGLL
jgi:hypothetical protein